MTRSGAKKRGGMPPLLPTSKNKKKASAKQIAAAKAATAASEAKKQPAVKVKTEAMPKRRLWTDEEDIALSKAYVNITTDPSVGTKQKGDAFWMRVHKKMCDLHESEAEVVQQDKEKWGHKSIESRFKLIGKAVQAFNGHCKAVTKENESGLMD